MKKHFSRIRSLIFSHYVQYRDLLHYSALIYLLNVLFQDHNFLIIMTAFFIFFGARAIFKKIDRMYVSANTVSNLDIINFKLFKKALYQDIIQNYNGNTCLVSIGFNHINSLDEQYGAGTYTAIMKEATLRLKTTMRDHDELGKSHKSFLILLTHLNTRSAYKSVVTRIVKLLNKPYKINDAIIKVSAHAGVMSYEATSGRILDLLKITDMAMYTAKIKNLTFYFPDEADASKKGLMRVAAYDLKYAIQNHQFALYYQPKKNIHTGQIVGVEALLRWQHPKYGMISPDKFIQISNEAELSAEITEWVAKRAIKNCADLNEMGYDISVSINVSANDVSNSDLLVTLVKAIDEYQLDPGKVVIELTEVSLLQDLESVTKLIVGMDSMGIQISLEDFDPYQLSLMYSKQLPLKELKIDRHLMYNMLSKKNDGPKIEDIIALAHNYGASVIAEKIESADDEKKFKDVGCDVVQGFHVAKPMPVNELIEWLQVQP